MATLKQKIKAEATMRELLRANGLPEPDGVEYGHGCIRLFFEEPKVALVVDIDNPEEDAKRWAEGNPRYGGGVWEQDQAVYDVEDDDEYEGGYEPGIWEVDDADLN
jgi:hypothetical protein